MAQTQVVVGYCNERDAFVAGKTLAESTLKDSPIQRVDLALAFCAGELEHHDFFEGLRSVIGPKAPIVGGSAVGIVTDNNLSYQGVPAGIALIQSDTIQCRVSAVGDLDKGEYLAGQKLARAIGNKSGDRILLVFYDSVRNPATMNASPVLNASAPLLTGIAEKLEPKTPILGAGLIGDYGLGPTKQFCGSYVESQSVVGVSFSGGFQPYYCIMHGCRPLDGTYHTITKMEGSVLYELDGKPIEEIIDDLFGNHKWREQHPVDYLTIGVNCGKKYAEPEEGKYVNRLITGIAPGGRGVGLFEPDLKQGMEIQFMLRDAEKMLDSARTNTSALVQRIQKDGRKALFGLYIDCAGRTATYSNTSHEEASEVQKVFKKCGVPLLGFYSGVEICPLMNKSRGLDWTGVLMVFAEDI